jgi:hypothetical protein
VISDLAIAPPGKQSLQQPAADSAWDGAQANGHPLDGAA